VRETTERALTAAREAGAEYADIRFTSLSSQSIHVKNGNVLQTNFQEDRGFGVRALVEGAWGFASSWESGDPQEVVNITRRAVSIARASARVQRGQEVFLSPLEPVEGSWTSCVDEDPFAVPLEDKLDVLLEADRRMREVEGVRVSDATMQCQREHKIFANTDGSYIVQDKTETGAGIAATAFSGGEVQRRSYPASFGGDFAARGFEFVREMDLVGHAEETAGQAVALLDAPQCPSGEMDLILGSSQLALQIHESCGHPIELDRVFGMEASFAGTSFLTADKLGAFQYGSDQVTIRADATVPGGLGSFGYDDEGVPATRTMIVDRGRFVNYLTSRDSASQLARLVPEDLPESSRASLVSNGTMRASGWNRVPLIRMTNINLDPGDWSLDEIIRDTKNGILMHTNKSWSIDDRRLNFQFGTEAGWEIRDGSLERMVRNPTYTGMTPRFWASLDAVASSDEWRMWGLPNCGKGEPPQAAHVGHGAAPARFRKVRVGVGKW